MGKVLLIVLIVMGMICFLVLFLYISESQIEANLRHLYLFTTRGKHYWLKLKHPAYQFYSSLFPNPHHLLIPHQESKGEEEAEQEDRREKVAGRGEKVKEAVEKSFEKTKSTVEDSAKTAAKIAVGKVKHTLTDRTPLTDPQDEL